MKRRPQTLSEAVIDLKRAFARLLRSVALAVDVEVPGVNYLGRGDAQAEPPFSQVLCYGVVQDAGGGMVDVWVERDTLEYPELGQRVALMAVGPRP